MRSSPEPCTLDTHDERGCPQPQSEISHLNQLYGTRNSLILERRHTVCRKSGSSVSAKRLFHSANVTVAAFRKMVKKTCHYTVAQIGSDHGIYCLCREQGDLRLLRL